MGAEFCLVCAVGTFEVRNVALLTRPPLLTRRGDWERSKRDTWAGPIHKTWPTDFGQGVSKQGSTGPGVPGLANRERR